MSNGKQRRNIGLARRLSKAGYCSRSRAGELIRVGRVRVNGTVRRDSETPTRPTDRITVDGADLFANQRLYLMLNKPRGVVTTASDERGRQTIYDCIDEELPWMAPVGRLDKASEGLLLLTNDSEWAEKILAPETHLSKTYHVQINRVADEDLLTAMLHGMRSEGDYLRVRHVRRLRNGKQNSWLEIVLDEGKNRHIRRMLSVLDVEVLRLLRVAIGPLTLGNLSKGAHRMLTTAEKEALDSTIERKRSSR
jgi:23S rRNA pseudouridine2605 synthase